MKGGIFMKITSYVRHGVAVFGVALLAIFSSTPAIAQAQHATQNQQVGLVEVKTALFDMLRIIEGVYGLDSKASDAVFYSDPGMWAAIPNKGQFVAGVQVMKNRYDEGVTARSLGLVEAYKPTDPGVFAGSPAFDPEYPVQQTNTYACIRAQALWALTFIPAPTGSPLKFRGRCGGDAYDIYMATVYGIGMTVQVARNVQAVIACDPTGIGCAVGQGILSTAEVAYLVARIPADNAAEHDAAIDSAEIQAGFMDAQRALGDISTHDANITSLVSGLASQVTGVASQVTGVASQVSGVASQVTVVDTKANTILTKLDFQSADTAALQTLLIRTQIETALFSSWVSGRRVGLFMVPAAFGGHLELVRDIVTDTIAKTLAAGLSVNSAVAMLNNANALFAAKSYKLAADSYAKAYVEAVR